MLNTPAPKFSNTTMDVSSHLFNGNLYSNHYVFLEENIYESMICFPQKHVINMPLSHL